MLDFLNKNKYGVAFVLIAAVAIVHYFFFYKRCEQPNNVQIVMSQLQCAKQATGEEVRAFICKELNREQNCEITEEDRSNIDELFFRFVDNCAKKALKDNNFCTDKYKALEQ